MKQTANVYANAPTAPSVTCINGSSGRAGSIFVGVLIAMLLSASGCTYQQIREHPSREVATMEMEVTNPDGTRQWKKVMRTVHEFEFPTNSREDEK